MVNNKTYKKNRIHFPKCKKAVTRYTDAKGTTFVHVDKNQQICSGELKGRPVKVIGKNLVYPVTTKVDGKMVFSHYEVLIENVKKVKPALRKKNKHKA